MLVGSVHVDTARGMIQVTFRNVGTGVATLVWLRVVVGTYTIVGLVPDVPRLMLMPGEGYHLIARTGPLPDPPPAVSGVALSCTDALGNRLFFPLSGKPYVMRPSTNTVTRFLRYKLRRVPIHDAPARDDWGFSRVAPGVDVRGLVRPPTSTAFLPRE